MRPVWIPAGIPTPRTRDGFSAGADAGEPKTPHGYPVSITTGYNIMLLHWLCVVSALLLLLYGSRLLSIYTVMTSVCKTVVGIAACRPSVTLYIYHVYFNCIFCHHDYCVSKDLS